MEAWEEVLLENFAPTIGTISYENGSYWEDEWLDESGDQTLEDRIRAVMDQLETQQAEYHCQYESL